MTVSEALMYAGAVAVVIATVAAIVAMRHPRHPIGAWFVLGVLGTVALAVGALSTEAEAKDGCRRDGGTVVVSAGDWRCSR